MAGIGVLLAQRTLHRQQKIERSQGPCDDSHWLISQNSKLKTQNSKLKTQNSKLKTQNSKLKT
jgi:cell division protein FtsB